MSKKKKGKKSKNIEKETRRLIESISDLLKHREGGYKFKGAKKKTIKEMKRNCPHWVIRKGVECPAVEELPNSPGYWTCKICGKKFRIKPFTENEYDQLCESFLGVVNQLFFLSVKMGGDSSDTKVFLKMKELIPKLNKIARNEIKQFNKREEFERRRHEGESSTFLPYTSYSL